MLVGRLMRCVLSAASTTRIPLLLGPTMELPSVDRLKARTVIVSWTSVRHWPTAGSTDSSACCTSEQPTKRLAIVRTRVPRQPTAWYDVVAASVVHLAGPRVAVGTTATGEGMVAGALGDADADGDGVGLAAELLAAGPAIEPNHSGAARASTRTAVAATTAAPRSRQCPSHAPSVHAARPRASATTRPTPATARPESSGVNVP